MPVHGHALFDTRIGVCGIAWGPFGVLAAQLPEADPASTRERLLRHAAGACREDAAPTPAIQAAIAGVQALFEGERPDLLDVELDTGSLTPFQRRVYQLTREIPPGQTRTYGELAQALGRPGLSRAVGQALGHNPFAPIVPCHRVLAAGQRPGGFSAAGGAATKLRMLAIEGAVGPDTAPLFPCG